METKIAIYLAGSIKKGSGANSYWADEDMTLLRDCLPDFELSFLNPAFRTDDLSDQKSVFGRDMTQVFSSQFVFADVRDRRGLGVGAELMWAKLHRIPVVSWAPRNSHYRKDMATILGVPVENFIHPFVEGLSDKIVENLEDGANWIEEVLSNPATPIKGIEEIGANMEYYKEKQLHRDLPMQELISANESLKLRMNRLLKNIEI